MKVKFLVSLFIGFLAICAAEKDTKENKDSKDKRQIGIHQTRVNPHQQIPDNAQLETVYGAHPNQFVIRAVGQGQPQLQYQPQQQVASQAEQLQEVGPQHFNYVPEGVQPQQGKGAGQAKQYPKKAKLERPVQYVQEVPQYVNQYQEQPYPHISEEQILRLLQEELKQQSAVAEQRQQLHRPQQTPIQNAPKQGLGSYREGPASGPAAFSYSPQSVPQQYYSQIPLDYHRAVPDHPLAASSLERELEKLVASNKPSVQYRQQQQIYKTPKPQSKPQPTPVPEEKGFSFFPDFTQLSSFNLPQASFLEQAPHPQKQPSNHGQYLTEVIPKQKAKPTSSPYQEKPQFYSSQQKSQSQYVPVTKEEAKNAALKVIDAPVLQYERPQAVTPTPDTIYYRGHGPQAPTQSHLEPSRSAIYVSQATGLRPTPQSPQQEKQYNAEKVVRLPPPDGKPITQEEFQALLDAGYPVEAVPVPVPVPYEKFIRDQRPEYRQIQEQPGTGVRRVKEDSQGITYLHPVALRQNQRKQPQEKVSS